MDRLCNENLENLPQGKKIFLVLDLDQTLLNSCLFSNLITGEGYLMSSCHDLPDTIKSSLYRLDSIHIITKLRPFVHSFLKEASKLFEMYVCTMGDRDYALKMAKLLDPGGEYFKSRVTAKEDFGTNQKGLDVVLGNYEESAVLILDDREDVWRREDKENLILVEGYHFFASSCQQFGLSSKSLSQLRTDESETHGTLAAILRVLQQIHSLFLKKNIGNSLANQDTRQALKTVRNEVLKGCKIVIIGVSFRVWRMAEQLGAECTTNLEPSVTHVVSVDKGTEQSRWAVSERKFLVHHRWVQAAFHLWQKQPEENYSLD